MQVERQIVSPLTVDRVFVVRVRAVASPAYMRWRKSESVPPPPPLVPLRACVARCRPDAPRRMRKCNRRRRRSACWRARAWSGGDIVCSGCTERARVRARAPCQGLDDDGTIIAGRRVYGKYWVVVVGGRAHPRRASREFGAHRPMCYLRSVQRLIA